MTAANYEKFSRSIEALWSLVKEDFDDTPPSVRTAILGFLLDLLFPDLDAPKVEAP